MMFELEVRGRLDNGNWFYGYLLPSDNGPDVVEIWKNRHIFATVKKSTVGLYTGLKDCQGTKIYEGDILESIYGPLFIIKQGKYIAYCPVDDTYMENVGFYAVFINDTAKLIPMPLGPTEQYAEVIGNIYDNPELLGGDSE